MKKTISIILSAAIILSSLMLANYFAFGNEAYKITINAAFNQTEARSILASINKMRTSKSSAWYWNEDNETVTECENLNELVYDYSLEQIAMQRAAELAVYFSHTRPDGRSAWTAYSDNGFILSAVTCGENIAAGYTTPQEVHNAWKEDFADYENQYHRRNILNSKYKAVGIGHVYYGGYHFWVEEFSERITNTDVQEAFNESKECEIKLSADFIKDINLKCEASSISLFEGSVVALPEFTAEINIQSPWLKLIDNEQISVIYSDEISVKNEEIAVIENGKIKGISKGHTEIYAVMNGIEISVPVKVTDGSHQHNFIWKSNGRNLVKYCAECGEEFSKLQFEDLNSYAFYGDYIEYTSVFNKFISGTNPPHYTEFSPQTPITRAMLIAILYRMAGNPYDGVNPHTNNPFSDVNENAYYYNAACWALDEGITNQLTFKPNDNVTREQTARFIFAYAEANNKLGDKAYKNVNLEKYPDYNSVHDWAKEPLQWANYNNMITGTQQGYINPQGATQRIHATRILYGFGKACNIGNFE